MKMNFKQIILVSFTLFSLFFGAGNLIFPPFLGQNAGFNTPLAFLGFLITAVALPILGVLVVAKFDGLNNLGNKVNVTFASVFAILIYLSIGPGLGIPRAASLPFEMAVAPYLPVDAPVRLYLLLFSFVFFAVATWLALSPGKLVSRIGKFLTPSLLILIVFLFVSFVFRGNKMIVEPTAAYATNPFVKGFLEGYMTMDTIAALNFGLVISLTLQSFKISEKKDIMKYTLLNGLIAGAILTFVYFMLSYMGQASSGVFELGANGSVTLRAIVYELFGDFGAYLLAAIFTLACLTTCVGLITSISQYFSSLTSKISYYAWVIIISLFSLIVCNQGLNRLLSFSVPLLDAIYPISIVLIILGLTDRFFKDNRYIYPWTITVVGIISIFYALRGAHLPIPFIDDFFATCLPFYTLGLGWFIPSLVTIGCSMVYAHFKK